MISRTPAYTWSSGAPLVCRSTFTDTETEKSWDVEAIYPTKHEAEAAFDFMLNALNDGIAAAKARALAEQESEGDV